MNKQIEIEFLDLTWIVDVEYNQGFYNGDPRDSVESQLINWSIDSVYYNNGWNEFSSDTVKELSLKHYKELRAQLIQEIGE